MAKNITKAKHRFPLRELRHLGKLLTQNWPVLALLIITGTLIFLNFEPNTFLTGWDNLHPEFDIAENLKRSLFSVWQEYRGPGLLGGMAHAADLPRVLLLNLLLAAKIPMELLRYITTFLPLVLGPLGVYFLFYNHLFREKLDSRTTQFASFLGALYYLLNLNTLQTFFVPFETFTWFYGALPWLLYFFLVYLGKPSFRRLVLLFVISFLSAPGFYVETIFVVFFLSLLPFVVEYLRRQKLRAAHLKNTLLSFIALILPHLFWLLPVAFFVVTNGSVAEQAKNNLMSSPETYARNLEFANLKDTALIKGYLFNYLDLGADNKYTYLLSTWRSHLGLPVVTLVGYLAFVLVLTGLYYSFKKKFPWTKSFIGVLVLCLFFLLGGGLLINQKLPLVGELFRSPFTKFSITLSLAYSFFFAIGSIFLLDLFTFLHSRLTFYLTLFTVTFSLLLFMSPAFSGNLISPSMRQNIPPEYFDLFAYMRTQDPSTRLANFPQYSFWGWESYDWGYRGSGFLWYGLRQPLMDRAFDAWDKNSEKYYEEMSTALYSGNQKNFEAVLDKYAINWILIDHHLSLPENAEDPGLSTLEKFVTTSSKFTKDNDFGDQISLYKVSLSTSPQNFLSLSAAEKNSSTFPFTSLSLRPNTGWIEKAEYLSTQIPIQAKEGDTLQIPSLTNTEALLPVRLEYRKQGGSLDLRLTPIIPIIFVDNSQIDLSVDPFIISLPGTTGTGYILELDGQYFEIQLPAEIDSFSDYYPLTTTYLPAKKSFSVSLFDSTESNPVNLTESLGRSTPSQCYSVKPNRKVEKVVTSDTLSLLGIDVVGCLSAPLPYIPQGSLISLSFTYFSPSLIPGNVNISGKNLDAINLPQPLKTQEKPTRNRLFSLSKGGSQQVNLILEAEGSKNVKEVNYQNIEVSTHGYIYSTKATLPPILGKKITLKADAQKIQVSLPKTETQYDLTQTPLDNSLLPENQNCDQFNLGNTVKQVNKDGFLYQSQNAIECDVLNLRHLPHTLSYLFTFDYRLQKGLAATICLENHSSRRCDVQERLINTKEPQSVIEPIVNSEEAPGYTLHLYHQSLGSRITSSLLKSISVRPIPLQFLQSIVIAKSETTTQSSTIPSMTSTHPYPFLYVVNVTDNLSSNLNLYQTKSPSWLALPVTSKEASLHPSLLSVILPFNALIQTKLTHTDTNLWHNSYILPEGNSNIILLYSPQYLEFLGFLAILLPLIYFLIKIIVTLIKKLLHSLYDHQRNRHH